MESTKKRGPSRSTGETNLAEGVSADSTREAVNEEQSAANNSLIDVAIIGGGIAGLYAAWRLKAKQVKPEESSDDNSQRRTDRNDSQQADGSDNQKESLNPALKVSLFEASPILGGRLHSVEIPGVAIPAELGAMRYTTPPLS